jgi:hypothetical protein
VDEGPLLAEDPLGDGLGQRRPVHLERVLLADGLVPAAEQEAGVVHVVVEVVMGEEEVIDVGGKDAGLDQLPGGRRPAVEHHVLTADLHRVGRAPPMRGGRWRAGTEDEDFGH